MKTILQILEDAKDLIKNSDNWTIGHFATDENDEEVNVASKKAVKFCALGAVRRVSKNKLAFNTELLLDATAVELFEEQMISSSNKKSFEQHYDTFLEHVNDELGHEAVMKVFDTIIEREKNK